MLHVLAYIAGGIAFLVFLVILAEDLVAPNSDTLRREKIIAEMKAMSDAALASHDVRLDMDKYLKLNNRLIALM